MIDYKELLRKYMLIVAAEEGVSPDRVLSDFDAQPETSGDTELTREEFDEIHRIFEESK